METIGKRIRTIREGLDISQKAFGARIGVSQTTLTALENDKNEPSMGTFNKIIEEFRVDPEWLRTGKGEAKPTPGQGTIKTVVASPLAVVADNEEVRELKEQIRELREHNRLLTELLKSDIDLSEIKKVLSFNSGEYSAAKNTQATMWAIHGDAEDIAA